MGNVPKSNERQFIRINILCSYSCPAHLCRAFYFYPCHASDNTNRLRHCKPYLLSRESVAQRQPHSDPGMVSGAPSDGTMVNKETGAEQFRPDNGRMHNRSPGDRADKPPRRDNKAHRFPLIVTGKCLRHARRLKTAGCHP